MKKGKKIVKGYIYILKNNNEENDLMIIEILSYKGYFECFYLTKKNIFFLLDLFLIYYSL